MGFRFRKSFSAGPFRVNLSKSGIGWSVGGNGVRFTKKASGGTRSTYSLPGTGLSYISDSSGKKRSAPKASATSKAISGTSNTGTSNGGGNNRGWLWWVLIGWWWWRIEVFVWLFSAPVYIAFEYIKYLIKGDTTEKFDVNAAAESPTVERWQSKTFYKTQFYTSNWFFIVSCIFMPLTAIAIVLLKRSKWDNKKKAIICGAIAFWWLILAASTCGETPDDSSLTSSSDIVASSTDTTISDSDAIISSSDEILTLSPTDIATSSSDSVSRQTTTTETTTTTTTSKITTTATEYVEMVWIPRSGSKYHCRQSCSNMENPREVTREEAERRGYTPCGRCY